MAGLGVFLPSETAYKDPGRFRDVLEAEGTKQARYLSSMDQFYAQMEESKRQFDVTSGQRERFFEEEMAFRGEELESETELKRWLKEKDIGLGELGIESREKLFEKELAFRGEELEAGTELQRWLKREDVRLGEYGIRSQERLGAEELGLGYERLGFEREKREQDVGVSDFLRGLYERQEERKDYETYRGVSSTPFSFSTPSGRAGSESESYGSIDFGEVTYSPETGYYSNVGTRGGYDTEESWDTDEYWDW